MVDNLHRTKEMGIRSRGLLESGDLESYAELMHEHWLNKRCSNKRCSIFCGTFVWRDDLHWPRLCHKS